MFTREKQNVNKFIGLALVLIMLSAALAVLFLSPTKAYAETASGLQVSDFVSHSEQNNEYTSFISNQNLAEIKSSLEKSAMSKTDMYKEIYQELGYSNEEIDKIGIEEINLIMESSIAITVTQQYLSIDEDGNQVVLSKEECLAAANAVNAKRESELQKRFLQVQSNQFSGQEEASVTEGTVTDGNDDNDAWAIDDTNGYIKITTRSDYINPSTVNGQQGWYNFSATYEWLAAPSQAYTDAFSIYAAGCAWSAGSTDIYSKMSYNYYDLDVYNGETEENYGYNEQERYTQDRTVQSTGVYYTYSVPESYSYLDVYIGLYFSHQISNLTYYIRAKARVSNYTVPQSFNVYSRYEHLTKSFNVSVSFDWSIGSWPGVSVTPTVGNNHTAYYS